jgi:hypothetical protein
VETEEADPAVAKPPDATPLRYVMRAGDKDFRALLGTLPKDASVIYASLRAPSAALIAKQLPDVGLGKVRMIAPDGQRESAGARPVRAARAPPAGRRPPS